MAKPQQCLLFSTFLLLIFFLFAAETQAKGKCKYMYGQCLTAFDYIAPHQREQECMRIAKGSINMPAAGVKECGFLDLGIMPKCWVCPGVKPLTPAGAKCGHRWAPCKTEYEYMIKYLAIKECEKLSPYFTTFDEQMQSCGFMNLGKRARCTICPGTPKNATVMDPVFLGTE